MYEHQQTGQPSDPPLILEDSGSTLAPTISVGPPDAKMAPSSPPPLPYSLHDHKRSIAINFLVILIGACFVPILVYFLLTRFTTLELSIIFTIITAVPISQLFDFARRTYLLCRRSSFSRPIGASRWSLDFYHYCYAVGVVVITILFSVGCAKARLDLIALPLPFLLTLVGFLICLTQALYHTGMKTPVRLSSLPRGAPLRPPVFTMVEDIVAVNGGGGIEFRRAWGQRYEASRTMQRLLGRLSWFWGLPALALGVGLCAAVGSTEGTALEVIYGISWAVPWVWAGLWSWITIAWVRKELQMEKEMFATGAEGV